MGTIGDIEKVYQAANLLMNFCAETVCTVCPIKDLCNKIDMASPIGHVIMENIRV